MQAINVLPDAKRLVESVRNGTPVTPKHDIAELVAAMQPGDTVTLDVYRGNDHRKVKVKLGERPSDLPK